MTRRGFLISAPQSGSGKTTVSLAIMASLVRRGLHVVPFKCGPDFIDPGYHRAVTGNSSINLDSWMCGEEYVLKSFQTSLTSPTGLTARTIAVIEGAMGLFDGLGASGREGSSARIAAITGVPVVLVVNARGMAASSAALVKGFAGFDPQVRLAGVIFNNVGSDSHAALLREVMAEHLPEIALFGCVPRDDALVISSRHLGLMTVEDNPLSDGFVGQLAEMAERCLDLDRLSQLQIPHRPLCPSGCPFTKWGSPSAPPLGACEKMVPPFVKGGPGGICIAVARDAAFCFMYEDNLQLLREAGAELIFFSPLADSALPPDICGIYLPGGYPELYAGQLAANVGMLQAIRKAVQADMPVYAECGGFVYLTQGIDSCGCQPSAGFVGIFPVRSRMLPRRKALGYRQVEVTQDTAIAAAGAVIRGHEFHYSEIGAMPEEVERCYQVSRRGELLATEGYRIRNCLGSYIHLHFGSNPDIAATFVANCRKLTS